MGTLTTSHWSILKFVYSGKATKFCKFSTLLLSVVHTDKNKVDIMKDFLAFSEYMNFNLNYFSITLTFINDYLLNIDDINKFLKFRSLLAFMVYLSFATLDESF